MLYRTSRGLVLESGTGFLWEDFSLTCLYARVKGPIGEVFTGSGKAKGSLAFRLEPHAGASAKAGALWTAGGTASLFPLVLGAEIGGLRVFTLAQPLAAASGTSRAVFAPPAGLAGPASGAGVSSGAFIDPIVFAQPEAVARALEILPGQRGIDFCLTGAEISTEKTGFSGALSLSASRQPAKAARAGWRPGAPALPAARLFSLSAAARFSNDRFALGAWVSGSAGYLAAPGLAFALDSAFSAQKNRGEAPEPVGPSLRAGFFVFGASQSYKTPLGAAPLYDFLAEVRFTFKGKALSFVSRASTASLSAPFLTAPSQPDSPSAGAGSGETGGRPFLARADADWLSLLAWRWRSDLVRCAADLEIDRYRLGGVFVLDPEGAKSAACSLSRRAAGAIPLSFGASLNCFFARQDESGPEDKTGADESSDKSIGIQATANERSSIRQEKTPGAGFGSGKSLFGNLALSSIRLGAELVWAGQGRAQAPDRGEGQSQDRKGFWGQGRAELALSAKKTEETFSFSLSGSLSQCFYIGRKGRLTVALQSPSGGFSLDRPPADLPRLRIEFSASGR